MLRELTSLSQNINFNSPGDSFRCHDPVTGGPAHKLSPSQGNLGSVSVPWGPSCYSIFQLTLGHWTLHIFFQFWYHLLAASVYTLIGLLTLFGPFCNPWHLLPHFHFCPTLSDFHFW